MLQQNTPADEMTLELLAADAERDAQQAALANDDDYLAWHDAKEAAYDALPSTPMTSAEIEAWFNPAA